MDLSALDVRVAPGKGAVIRAEACLAVVLDDADDPFLTWLRDVMSTPNEPTIDSILRAYEGRDLAGAVLTTSATGVMVAAVVGAEIVTQSGRSSARTKGDPVREELSLNDLVAVLPLGGKVRNLPSWSQLDLGAARGAGVVFGDQQPSGTTPDRPAEPVPQPVEEDAGPFVVTDLSEPFDLSDRTPLAVPGEAQTAAAPEAVEPQHDGPNYAAPVMVLGVLSPRGFFNHPDAASCSRTGVKMGASQTRALVEGPRPPLGVFTFDDGSTYSVQWPTVIGRDPSIDERVRSGDAAPFVLVDDAQTVSRRHLSVELEDWDVIISDLGTPNGTYLRPDAASAPRRLGAGERATLNSGCQVTLGDRSFTYDEHHRR